MKFNFLYDLFAFSPALSYQGKYKFPTKIGQFFSIVLIAIVFMIFFTLGKELWQKQQPALSQSSFHQSKKIFLKDFPILFAIANVKGIVMSNPFIYMNALVQFWSQDFEGNVTLQYRNLTSCLNVINRFDAEKQKMIVNSQSYENTFCVDFESNDFLLNGYAERNSQFLQLIFTYCIQGNQCKNINESQAILKDKYLAIAYIDSYIDGFNYEQPIQQFPTQTVMKISFQFSKSISIQISNTLVTQDNGFLFSNIENKYSYQKTNSITDINDANLSLFQITINSNNLILVTTRTYLTFGEVLAKVLAYFSALQFILFFLLFQFAQFSFVLDFAQTLDKLGYRIKRNNDKNQKQISILSKRPKILNPQQMEDQFKIKNVKIFQFYKLRFKAFLSKDNLDPNETSKLNYLNDIFEITDKILRIETIVEILLLIISNNKSQLNKGNNFTLTNLSKNQIFLGNPKSLNFLQTSLMQNSIGDPKKIDLNDVI